MLFAPSIRSKITFGLYLLLFFMVGTVVLTYGIVWKVEKKVLFLEVVDDFFNTALEIRRFEKNYFLYNMEEDYREAQAYANKLDRLVYTYKTELSLLLSPGQIENLKEKINEYMIEMEGLSHLLNQHKSTGTISKKSRNQREQKIRQLGKEVTTIAETVTKFERQTIQHLLKTTESILLVSILFLLLLGLSMAALMGKRIVNGLKILEEHTKNISRGVFNEAHYDSTDREITTVVQALNRMINELHSRQRQLVQSEKLASLGTLLSGVAHELNNPLSNISTSAQILAEELDSGDIEFERKLIRQVNEQADRARDIVKTLLEFSRIKEFRKEKLKLGKLLDETILLVRGQVPSEVEISVDIPSDLLITADKQRLQQVFINLIKNALDVLDEEGHIWISGRLTTNAANSRDEVEIMVGDNGPGIPPEYLNNIFDPFFTTKDVGKGSGLGLFIVHDIIDWHGGAINVESRQGEGTTFIFWLPQEKEE